MMSKPEFVKIKPIEFQLMTSKKNKKKNRHPRIIRYKQISISPNFDQCCVDRVIRETKMEKRAVSEDSIDQLIFYQYEGRPLIGIDLVEHGFYTKRETIDKYGVDKCQQQATIVLKLLKRYGYATFKRVGFTANTERLGETRAEREETYQMVERLLGKASESEV
jgi:hypothetical protein